MSVRQDEKGGWRADVCVVSPDGRTMRRRKRCRTRREAERYEHELRVALLSGTYDRRREQAPLFKEHVERYLETYATDNNKYATVRWKRQTFDAYLLPSLGGLRVDAIGAADVDLLKAKLRRLAPKTINNVLTVLRSYLDRLRRWGYLTAVPTIEWQRVPTPKWRFLSHAELAAVLEHAGAWQCMATVAAHTGLRAGELRGLQWQDIDWERCLLHVRRAIVRGRETSPKNGKSRVVPLNEVAIGELRAHRHLVAHWVWCSENGPVSESAMRRGLIEACEDADVEACGWHALRHTFASHLVQAGVPLYTVRELMGHSSLAITHRYAHLAPDTLSEAVRRLETTGVTAQQRPTAPR